tara:strand:+ start:3138 stop:3428 length:291 start_codon:yes stop_codon:yes gene_type:complete
MIKLSKLITEARELPERDIKLLAKMTDMNNHNEARVHLARAVGNKNLVKSYEAIMVLHSMFNQMNEMMAARTKLDKMLFTQAKRYFSNYDEVQGAF